MASHRRTNTGNPSVPKSIPYRIYSEANNTGKNYAGSKKVIRWLYGWTGDSNEEEVSLKHSIVTGKKSVYHNGREVTTSKVVLTADFSHGWENNGNIYRVEVNQSFSNEQWYSFSINGVKFDDLPNKADALASERKQTSKTESNNAQPAKKPAARPASQPKDHSNSDHYSPSNESSRDTSNKHKTSQQESTFQPFGNSGNTQIDLFENSSDPFASNTNSNHASSLSNLPKPKPAATSHTSKSSANASVDLLGPAPVDFMSATSTTISTSSDPFASSPFSTTPAPAPAAYDPFGPQPAKGTLDKLNLDLASINFNATAPVTNNSYDQRGGGGAGYNQLPQPPPTNNEYVASETPSGDWANNLVNLDNLNGTKPIQVKKTFTPALNQIQSSQGPIASSAKPVMKPPPAPIQIGGGQQPMGMGGQQPMGMGGQQPMGMGGQQPMGMGGQQPMGMGMGGQQPMGMGMGMGGQQPMGMGMGGQQPMGMGMGGQQPMGMGGQQPMGMGGQQPMGMGGQQPMGMGGQQPMGMGMGGQQPMGMGMGGQQPMGMGMGRPINIPTGGQQSSVPVGMGVGMGMGSRPLGSYGAGSTPYTAQQPAKPKNPFDFTGL